MTLAELSHDEQVALLALLGLMARLDGQAAYDELDLIDRVTEEIGPDAFRTVADEAGRLEGDQIKLAALKVTRPEAREVLYELLYDMAIRESIVEREAELLDYLANAWDLPRRTGAAG